jgi:hypothetical protein
MSNTTIVFQLRVEEGREAVFRVSLPEAVEGELGCSGDWRLDDLGATDDLHPASTCGAIHEDRDVDWQGEVHGGCGRVREC